MESEFHLDWCWSWNPIQGKEFCWNNKNKCLLDLIQCIDWMIELLNWLWWWVFCHKNQLMKSAMSNRVPNSGCVIFIKYVTWNIHVIETIDSWPAGLKHTQVVSPGAVAHYHGLFATVSIPMSRSWYDEFLIWLFVRKVVKNLQSYNMEAKHSGHRGKIAIIGRLVSTKYYSKLCLKEIVFVRELCEHTS